MRWRTAWDAAVTHTPVFSSKCFLPLKQHTAEPYAERKMLLTCWFRGIFLNSFCFLAEQSFSIRFLDFKRPCPGQIRTLNWLRMYFKGNLLKRAFTSTLMKKHCGADDRTQGASSSEQIQVQETSVEGKVPKLIKRAKQQHQTLAQDLKYCLCRKSFIYSSRGKVERSSKWGSQQTVILSVVATLDVVLVKTSLCHEAQDLVHEGSFSSYQVLFEILQCMFGSPVWRNFHPNYKCSFVLLFSLYCWNIFITVLVKFRFID